MGLFGLLKEISPTSPRQQTYLYLVNKLFGGNALGEELFAKEAINNLRTELIIQDQFKTDFFNALKKDGRFGKGKNVPYLDDFLGLKNTFKNLMPERIKKTTKELSTKLTIKEIELTNGELISLYCHSKNPDNWKAIIKGGIGFKKSETSNIARVISEDGFNKILNDGVTEEIKVVGDAILSINEKLDDILDESFYMINGFRMPRARPSYPTKAMESYRAETYETIRPVVSQARLTERVDSTKPIYLDDAFEVFTDSVNYASKYVAQTEWTIKVDRLFSDLDFKRNFKMLVGDDIYNVFVNEFRSIAGVERYEESDNSSALLVYLWVLLAIIDRCYLN
ncbi:MAG: hypothetical protein JRJ49_05975 [Deltaproteobacteria bacterium]|nr:hypothetical protein [Deltaproteobacteria bacterium]